MTKAEIAASLLAAFLVAAPPAGKLFAQQGSATEAPDGAARSLTDAEMLLAGAEANRIDVILHLLGKGVEPNAQVKGGFTALIAAAGRGSTEALELLLARGADVNLANDEGWTPLMEAAAREQEEALKLLLRAGADANAREARRGLTVLMVAARADSPANLSALLQAGSDPNVAGSERGLTALHLALASDGLKTVESVGELLVAGADPGKPAEDGYTPLMAAAESGMVDKLGLILSEKVDVNAATKDGRTALTIAASMAKPELARHLLASGAAVTPPEGQVTPLAAAIRSGSLGTTKLVVEAGADLNRPDPNGKTPLILAVLGAHDELVEMLLEKGADPNGRNASDGTTPLMWAANTGRRSYVELLLQRGADAGIEANDGWTAGEAARMAGHVEIARLLDRRI